MNIFYTIVSYIVHQKLCCLPWTLKYHVFLA